MQHSRNRYNSLKNELIYKIIKSQDSQESNEVYMRTGINHQVDYESDSENNKKQIRARQYNSDKFEQKTFGSQALHLSHKLNHT